MASDVKKSNYSTPNKKLWVYGLLIVSIIAALAYFGLLSKKDRSINHDYYRILYEASNTFNENMSKLDSMHQYRESVSSIRSLLPSYSRVWQTNVGDITQNTSIIPEQAKTFKYEVVGTLLYVTSPEAPSFKAQLDIGDILPNPKKGFSQYLFANGNEVLAMVGDERTISIVELDSINEQIQTKNKQFQLNFSDTKGSVNKGGQAPLPTYSNHVDMKISYGEFRVYIFPFTLNTPLNQSKVGEATTSLDRLYLVGLLPQNKLASRDSGDWNISLLFVSLASLLFMWCMLRLFLLPKNQSITKTFRVLVAGSSYLFFVILVSLVLSYNQKTTLQTQKDNMAKQYAKTIEVSLAQDVYSAFSELASFRKFYYTLISAIYMIPSEQQDSGEFSADQIQRFNSNLKKALLTINDSPCGGPENLSKQVIDSLPGKAGTAQKQYPIVYNCNLPTDDPNFLSVAFDSHAISTIIRASRTNKGGEPTLDFYANDQIVKLVPGESLETSIKPTFNRKTPNKVLSVFALDREGNSVLPSINFQEGNSLPTTFNLSHRDYYKKVRDHQGWNIDIPAQYLKKIDDSITTDQSYRNIYIQRLLNVNNGTRGSTISMPIVEPSEENSTTKVLDYIIGADVILPSLSLGQSPPYDFVYMVVDRGSGEVLFHNDSSRSLVENLYFAGDTSSPLSKWLKAGLDHYEELSKGMIEGVYHGQDGRFAVSQTIIDKWAVVVFYPNDSLQTFMTNQFLYITITFVVMIGLMITGLYGVRQYVWTSTLKRKLSLPSTLNIRLIMLVSSMFFAGGYCFYIIGYSLEYLVFEQSDTSFTFLVPVIGLSLASLLVYRECFRYFCSPSLGVKQTLSARAKELAKRGSRRLIIVILVVVGIHFLYLQNTADAPHKSLDFHYQQLACNWLNYEREELTLIGLTRYPNSITSSRISPLDLLPIDEDWRARLEKRDAPRTSEGESENTQSENASNSRCENHSTQVHPDDYPSLSSVFGATYLWQWINIYILDKEFAVDYVPFNRIAVNSADANRIASSLFNQTLLFALILGVIAIAWFRFNTRFIWRKMYCSDRFLHHIQNMTESVREKSVEKRATNLKIECDTVKLNGIGLALLLRTMSLGKEQHANNLLDGFDELFAMSPCLQKFSEDNQFLPNLKLHIKKHKGSSLLHVELWDIETSLEKSDCRSLLLDLIMELKSLTLSNQLASFTIFTGFHSLQRVKMKDPLIIDNGTALENTEYLSWAECLMDFVVNVPETFKQRLDWHLLKDEVAAFPEIAFLGKDVADEEKHNENWREIIKGNDDVLIESRLATINYILLHADALYRFKWESCSSAEKLALINLAKQQRINPANTQMIEHLALNGLIKVRKGKLDIINSSFAHFVLHAETAETLNSLIASGEAGVWKNYKLPLGILIVLVIGGIALTSGESIYIVAASLAGILGTIASVTTSANMLRGQMQE